MEIALGMGMGMEVLTWMIWLTTPRTGRVFSRSGLLILIICQNSYELPLLPPAILLYGYNLVLDIENLQWSYDNKKQAPICKGQQIKLVS